VIRVEIMFRIVSVMSLNKNVTSVKQYKHLSMTGKAKDKGKPGFQCRSAITQFSCQYLLRENMANDGVSKKVEMTKSALELPHLGPLGFCGHLFRLDDAVVRFTLAVQKAWPGGARPNANVV
jgi:hypothetical protein